MKNMKASLLSEAPPMQDSEVSDGGEEEVTTSQSSASMQVFAAVRDAFRIKNGIKWEKFPRGQTPPPPPVWEFFRRNTVFF